MVAKTMQAAPQLLSDMMQAVPDLSSFLAFRKTFPLSGGKKYVTLFKRHTDVVQTKKATPKSRFLIF